jgi:hypothetical protein
MASALRCAMRTILLLPLLPLVLVGCGGADPEEFAKQVCGAGSSRAVDAAMYDALTAPSWFVRSRCESSDRLPPTCNRVRLSGDGTYTWTAFSDYPERDQAGAWSFRARDETSGLVCLDNGSVVDVALSPTGGLRWGPLGELDPEDRLEPGPGRDALPTISVDLLFVDLTASTWAKTNEMELYRLPTSLTLRRDGTFEAEFRGGECTASGTFSLLREETFRDSHLELWSTTAPNRCDTRNGGSPFVLGGLPRLEDGRLDLGDSQYRDAANETARRYLAFSSYGNDAGLTVTATWDGALRAGAETSWEITLHSGADPQLVSSLRIDLTPMMMTTDGFTATGPAALVVDRALDAMIRAVDALRVGDVVFTPGPAGWTMLHVEVDSSSGLQSYRNQESFLVELP